MFGLELKNVEMIEESELNTALRLLDQSLSSEILETQKNLLRKARLRFTKALFLEEKLERSIIAYIGLALCHKGLGDLENIKSTLLNFVNRTDIWNTIEKRKKRDKLINFLKPINYLIKRKNINYDELLKLRQEAQQYINNIY